MPSLPNNPLLPQYPLNGGPPETKSWASSFVQTLGRTWSELVYTVNTLCRVDTLANRRATPDLDESFFVASDTYQVSVGINGVWAAAGRVSGTTMGAIPFTEISDPAAPAANGARLYVRDNGSGKTQLCVIFNTGSVQVIATEP